LPVEKKMNVAVLYGGVSPEHMISRASANKIISSLSSEKYNILPVYINKEGSWNLYENYEKNLKDFEWEKIGSDVSLSINHDFSGLIRFMSNEFNLIDIDLVIPVFHGENGEDGTIQGLLEIARIPYVGCGVLSSSISLDKSIMRIIAHEYNVSQTKYILLSDIDFKDNSKNILNKLKKDIGYPCFVKPCNSGSSIGINKAKNENEAVEALSVAFNYDRKVLIEKEIIGKELECAVMGSAIDDEIYSSGVGELNLKADFYSYDAKYIDADSKVIIPAKLEQKTLEDIKNLSKKIFKIFDCSGLARIDFFLENKTNKIFFNELNTFPGFTSISMYPLLWEHEGLSTSDLLDKLIEIALKKKKNKENRIWKIEQ
jgi:D-alanine-D-alanine ligase